jgi:formate-dependent nitrite reductase cytochrome c552 subunit
LTYVNAVHRVVGQHDRCGTRSRCGAGSALWEAPHPDVETYYGSKHEKAGVDCTACHLPRVRDPKTGKLYTSHWQTNPKNDIKETLLRCQNEWTETQARCVIESMASHYQGKVHHAEFWLMQLIAKSVAVSQDGLNILDDAIRAKQAPSGASPAAPMPAAASR